MYNKTYPSLHPFMSEVQTEVSGLGFVHKHCHKPGIIHLKAMGFAPRSLRIHLFRKESYILREPF